MNPELVRNLWLELTPRRLVLMAVVVGLILLTVSITPFGQFGRVQNTAQYLFYGIVVAWGAREAAQAVVGEIRERTWDLQRLSALTPFEMTLGKLLGATSYVWFGGLICLAVIIARDIRNDPSRVWADLFYFPTMGLGAQAIALFTSLIAVRRRQTSTRFNVFQYQVAGMITGGYLWTLWSLLNPNEAGRVSVPTVAWWGWTIDAKEFFVVSLGVFVAWTLVGCYRLMRLELQMQNRPTVWPVFILFMAAYMAGFENLLFVTRLLPFIDALSLRLIRATATLGFLTYVAVLFEPKDRVLYRWLGEMLAKGRTAAVMSRLQCWMISYAAAMISGIVLASHLGAAAMAAAAMVIAGMGFLTRDLGVFLFFGLAPGQKRGDMPAVISLALLYLLLPRLLLAAGVAEAAAMLLPVPGAGWVGAIYAWVEAIAVWFLVVSIRGKQTAALPQN